MTIRPDVPAAARLMEAARSLRLEAQALRRETPPRRAVSQAAEVDVEPDGRLIAMRIVDARLIPSGQWAAHLTELYRAATGGQAEGVVVQDLVSDELPPMARGLGPSRYSFPPGIDEDAPPSVVLAQINTRLRSRFAAAEAASMKVAEIVGTGSSSNDEVVVTVGSLGNLVDLRISSLLATHNPETVDAALADALQAAHDDVRHQIDSLLNQEGF